MRLTVAVCTWNRCERLRAGLTEMTRLLPQEGVEWELLVVNNNSTDATDDVIASFAGRLPVRRLFEPRQGVAYARNLAVREAAGDYIVWTDDDTAVDHEWLRAYVRAFRDHPAAAVFGGPIAPWWSVTPPAWLATAFDLVSDAYGVREFGDQPLKLSDTVVPFGANMAVRSAEHRRFLYDPTTGRAPGRDTRGLETPVIRAVLAAGGEGWWTPEARVRHYIPPEFVNGGYIRRFYFAEGKRYSRYHPDPRHPRLLLGRPIGLWRAALASALRYRLARLVGGPRAWVAAMTRAAYVRGNLAGYRREGGPPAG
ncbi:MAG: glycosyltransferase family 2 protein [Planctomycetes bacterium]|nr:glycosyltransferase family 2 protein [Planctomycetota bacterium]